MSTTGYAAVEIDSRKGLLDDEEVTLFFVSQDKEYPFLVTNGSQTFDCISWDEAKDKYEHFFAFAQVQHAA